MTKPHRIINLVGARPQFIKASAISRILQADKRFEEILVHSGQHYDKNMSDVFFKDLGIPKPKHNLGISNESAEHVVDAIRKSFEGVLKAESPDEDIHCKNGKYASQFIESIYTHFRA